MLDALLRMLEIALPDLLTALRSMRGSKDRRNHLELARHVAKLFFTATNCSATGELILLDLYALVSTYENKGENDARLRHAVYRLRSLLATQASNLGDLRGVLSAKGEALCILSETAYLQMLNYTSWKEGLVNDTIRFLNNSMLELEFAPQYTPGKNNPIINFDEQLSATAISTIQQYLSQSIFRSSIDSLDTIISQLREEVSKTFTTDELLKSLQIKARH